jgi:hypothetical protein
MLLVLEGGTCLFSTVSCPCLKSGNGGGKGEVEIEVTVAECAW